METFTDQDQIRREVKRRTEAERKEFDQPEAEAGQNPQDRDDPDMGHTFNHEPLNFTDLGLAKRFVWKYGRQIRYVYPWKSWLFYDGERWGRDLSGHIPRLMKETVQLIYREASQEASQTRRKAIAKFAFSAEAEAKRRAAILSAQSEVGIPVLPESLDRDGFLLNVKNGSLDLRTGQLIPHDPGHMITKLAPVHFLQEADCPNWLKFLDRIFISNKRLIEYLQRVVGYSLTGNTSEQILHFLYGLGANGKSTFIKILMGMLGDYAIQTATETIMIRKNGGGIPNDLAALRGARFVSAQEVDSGHRMSESLIKQMTGGDRITARFLHGEFFEFDPEFKLWISGNSKPAIRGTDYAIWRRVRVIPFNVQIPPSEQDKKLGEKLQGELPGILNWALDGCLAWQREGGLNPTEEVLLATEGYKSEMDIVGRFINERCSVDPRYVVAARDLYGDFKDWSEEQGEKWIMTQQAFGMRLKEKGFESKRGGSTGAYRYSGIGLKAGD